MKQNRNVENVQSRQISVTKVTLLRWRLNNFQFFVCVQLAYFSEDAFKEELVRTVETGSFFTGQMPFLSPYQQCRSTEWANTSATKKIEWYVAYIYMRWIFCLEFDDDVVQECIERICQSIN